MVGGELAHYGCARCWCGFFLCSSCSNPTALGCVHFRPAVVESSASLFEETWSIDSTSEGLSAAVFATPLSQRVAALSVGNLNDGSMYMFRFETFIPGTNIGNFALMPMLVNSPPSGGYVSLVDREVCGGAREAGRGVEVEAELGACRGNHNRSPCRCANRCPRCFLAGV
jgi:hypothetical protein